MTHAFFKALLFLGAGAVIHSLHDEQDITRMGGLKKSMPATYRTQVIAALAIAGVPPLAGFFSKDEILWRAFDGGHVILWTVGLVTAGLTAFYMFRMISMVFEGEARYSHDRHPHEAPATMLVPLIILAFLSVTGGFLGIPHALGGGNLLEGWLEPVFARTSRLLVTGGHGSIPTEYLLMILSVAVGVAGILFARNIYLRRPETAARAASRYRRLHGLLFNKYFVDEVYDRLVITPLQKLSGALLWRGIDVGIIDGTVNGTARLMSWLSGAARRIQTGEVAGYGLMILVGITVLLGIYFFG